MSTVAQTFPAVADYSMSHPPSLGPYVGCIRYLGTDSRCITKSELVRLHADGRGVGFVYETSANRPIGGYGAGLADGRAANAYAGQLGVPAWVPIAYAYDFEPSANQLGVCADYFRGVLAAGGRPAVPYGCFALGQYLVITLGLAPSFWQCCAWSYGKVSTKAHAYQTLGYVLGNSSDHNNLWASANQILWHPSWSAADEWSAPAPLDPPASVAGPTKQEIIMVRNDNTEEMDVLVETNGVLRWHQLTPPEAAALVKLGVTVTANVGRGDDAADAAYALFQR